MSRVVLWVTATSLFFAFMAGGAQRKPVDQSGADRLLAHAKAAYSEGKYADTVRDLTAALQMKDPNLELYKLRAEAYMKLGDWANAVSDYDRILALGDEQASIYNSRGDALTKLGQFDRAIDSYSRAIKVRMDDPILWKNRGQVYSVVGRSRDAIEDLNQAVHLKPISQQRGQDAAPPTWSWATSLGQNRISTGQSSSIRITSKCMVCGVRPWLDWAIFQTWWRTIRRHCNSNQVTLIFIWPVRRHGQRSVRIRRR